jgi:hypothetical protein
VKNGGTVLTRLMASAVYRGVNLVYRTAPSERALRFLLHFNKCVGLATWMVVCRHFDETPAGNDTLMRFTKEFIRTNISPGDTCWMLGANRGT